MDVILTVASIGLSSYLPQCVVQPPLHAKAVPVRVQAPPLTIRVAATLSFLLLTLSILDFVPLSWMVLLDDTLLPLAYRSLFWLMVICVLIIFPAILGARLVGNTVDAWLGTVSNNNTTATTGYCRRFGNSNSNSRGWFSLAWKLTKAVMGLLWILLDNLLLRPLWRLLTRRWAVSGSASSSSSSSVLPTTTTTSSNTLQSPVSYNKANHTNSFFGFPLRCGAIMGSIVTIALTILVVSTISPWFVRTTSHYPQQQQQQHALGIAVSWLCALGILLSSIVNGFGSVSLPYSCLAGLYLEPISDEAIQRAQQELQRTRQSMARRQEELSMCGGLGSGTGNASAAAIASGGNAESTPSTTTSSGPPASGNSVSLSTTSRLTPRWSFASPSSTGTTEERHEESRRNQLIQDIAFLETLVQELEQEVYDMLDAQQMAAQARTPWGRIRSWLGVLFSIVLVIRLVGAAWFVWRHNHGGARGAGSDLVTMTVLWLVGHNYVNQQQYNTASQVISLLLTAYLSMAQVGTFVRAVDAVYRRIQQCWRPCGDNESWSSSQPHPPLESSSRRFASLHSQLRSGSAYAPIVSSLMACYFLACVVLTKLLVPSAYRKALAVALHETSNLSHHRGVPPPNLNDQQVLGFFLRIRSYAVNSVFLVTALASCLALGMMLGLKRQQSLRHRSSSWPALSPAPSKVLVESA